MVDIETTGTRPDLHAMFQLAAVAFDWNTGITGPTFNMKLNIPPGRHWDEGTRDWWSKNPTAFEMASSNPQPPREVMLAFRDWVVATTGALEKPRFWAKPSTFDYQFVSSYFHQYEIENPFHFRDVIDMQSFIRGMRHNPGAPAFDREVEFEGVAHNGVDDVYHQILVALTAKHKFSEGEPIAA
jgi:hypothetical protein